VALAGIVGMIAGVVAPVSFIGSFMVVSALFQAISDAGKATVDMIEGLLTTNEDELACAIYQSDGTEDALAQFETKVNELFDPVVALIINGLFTEELIRAFLGGRYGSSDVAAALAADGYDPLNYFCTCEEPPLGEWEYTETYASSLNGWYQSGGTNHAWNSGRGQPPGCSQITYIGSSGGYLAWYYDIIFAADQRWGWTEPPTGYTYELTHVSFDLKMYHAAPAPSPKWDVYIQGMNAAGSWVTLLTVTDVTWSTVEGDSEGWANYSANIDPAFKLKRGSEVFRILAHVEFTGGNAGYMRVDNIHVAANTVAV
jgi:hypothetical protein